ncbi:MAG: hypothetical protein SFV15_14485 [Polyangiaceae bacterium]|nr:hypothetical protein [Polyangiaceae bacterium]
MLKLSIRWGRMLVTDAWHLESALARLNEMTGVQANGESVVAFDGYFASVIWPLLV